MDSTAASLNWIIEDVMLRPGNESFLSSFFLSEIAEVSMDLGESSLLAEMNFNILLSLSEDSIVLLPEIG
jgi:hypothetical protein